MTPEQKMTILEHLEDLRKCLIISIAAVIIASIPAFYYSEQILIAIQHPLAITKLKLNFTGIMTPFYVKLTLSLITGLIAAFPIVAWQIWRFVAPALYPNERKYILWLFPVVMILFAGGVLFGFFVILPAALYFLVVTMGQGLQPILTVDDYVSKMIGFTLPFGFLFELPVVIMFLTKIGIITPKWLAEKRKYAVLIIFIIAALLTPGPDPVSQCLLGIPVYLLYEISILVSKMVRPRKKPADDDAEDNTDNTGAEVAAADERDPADPVI